MLTQDLDTAIYLDTDAALVLACYRAGLKAVDPAASDHWIEIGTQLERQTANRSDLSSPGTGAERRKARRFEWRTGALLTVGATLYVVRTANLSRTGARVSVESGVKITIGQSVSISVPDLEFYAKAQVIGRDHAGVRLRFI